jgi:hypothetical protein
MFVALSLFVSYLSIDRNVFEFEPKSIILSNLNLGIERNVDRSIDRLLPLAICLHTLSGTRGRRAEP